MEQWTEIGVAAPDKWSELSRKRIDSMHNRVAFNDRQSRESCETSQLARHVVQRRASHASGSVDTHE